MEISHHPHDLPALFIHKLAPRLTEDADGVAHRFRHFVHVQRRLVEQKRGVHIAFHILLKPPAPLDVDAQRLDEVG